MVGDMPSLSSSLVNGTVGKLKCLFLPLLSFISNTFAQCRNTKFQTSNPSSLLSDPPQGEREMGEKKRTRHLQVPAIASDEGVNVSLYSLAFPQPSRVRFTTTWLDPKKICPRPKTERYVDFKRKIRKTRFRALHSHFFSFSMSEGGNFPPIAWRLSRQPKSFTKAKKFMSDFYLPVPAQERRAGLLLPLRKACGKESILV